MMPASRVASLGVAVALSATIAAPRPARAQACCAGASALTPARLALHEDALVAASIRTTDIVGSFNPSGHYVASPAGTSELDFEQDLIGTLRVLGRGQVSAVVPLVE